MPESRILWIPIGELPAEVVLAADLSDPAGRVLLPAGTQLTGHLRESLQRRGISAVPVAAPEVEMDEAAKEELVGQLEQHLDWLFRHAGQAPVAEQLRQVIFQHRLSKMTGQSSFPSEIDS